MATLRDKGFSSRFVILINFQLHQLGMARMAAAHLDLKGLELEIFTEIDEALHWASNASASEAAVKNPLVEPFYPGLA